MMRHCTSKQKKKVVNQEHIFSYNKLLSHFTCVLSMGMSIKKSYFRMYLNQILRTKLSLTVVHATIHENGLRHVG